MRFLCSFLILAFTSLAQAGVDSNTCHYSNDGACDDGGPNSQYGVCALGTDLNDCGPRFAEPEVPPISTEYPSSRVEEGVKLACKKAFKKQIVTDKKSCRQEVKSYIKDKEKKQRNPFLILSRLYIKNKFGKKGGSNGQQCTQLTADYNHLRNEYESAQHDWTEERNELQASIEDMSSEITQLVSDNAYLKSELNKYKPSSSHQKFACYAACTRSIGEPDLRYAGKGIGSLRSQALGNAIEDTRSKYNCNYGIVEASCGEITYPRKTYCSAACTKSDGKTPDTNYLVGATANSRVEAKYNAIEAVKSKYNCGNNIAIFSCESQ